MVTSRQSCQNGGMHASVPDDQVSHTHDSFLDDRGVRIHTYSWVPEAPKAVVQIAHGVGEHALRYDRFARALAGAGYAVVANDHRGHGETGREQHRGDLSRLGKLGPGGLRAAEAAMVNVTELTRSRFGGLPLILFAHSWGSLMGQRIINRQPGLYDAVILSGSAYRLPGFMESGALNKHFTSFGSTGFEWLSRDETVWDAFGKDELCFDADILKLFGPVDALKLFGVPGAYVANVPMLIMSGTDDALAKGDSLERLAAAYRNRGVADVTLTLYPGGRHEMLNETNRDEVTRDIIAWLDARSEGVA